MNTSFLEGRSFEGFRVRLLEEGDYDKGFLSLLGELTVVGDVAREVFVAKVAAREAQGTVTVVVEDAAGGCVVATGALVVEHKFVHGCGSVGHVEDVVVSAQYRGKKLGLRVIEALQEAAIAAGCYKVILDADEKNLGFYEKLHFRRKEVQMRFDCDKTQQGV